MKKILASLLALCMLCTFLPCTALGEDAPDIPDFEPEELLREELLFEPAPEEELIPEETEPGPLPEDLPEFPAELEEVPLLQTLEEAEKFETGVSGTVYASSLKANDTITLTGDTTLIMDDSRTLKSISGRDYSLTVQGNGTLTVRNPDGKGIHVDSFSCSAPLDVEAYDDAVLAQTGNITISNDLKIQVAEGDGLRSFSGNLHVLGGTVNITVEKYTGIAASKNVTLSGNITVTSGGYSIISKAGTIQIASGEVNVKNTGYDLYNPHGIISWGDIEFLGGSVKVSAPSHALESRHGITIKSPLSIEFPYGGEVREYYVTSYEWYTIYDAYGNEASQIEISLPSLIRHYVNRCYQEILGRDGEPVGIEYWTNTLVTHMAAGVDIVESFCNSQEFIDGEYSEEHIIWKLYAAMMDREPDDGGLKHWRYMMEDLGCSCKLVIQQFAASAEFRKICSDYGIIPGTPDDVALELRDLNPQLTGFVNRCYRVALKRYGDPDGLNYWAGQLLSRAQTPQQMAMNFLHSEEFLKRDLDVEDYLCALYDLYMGHDYDEEGFRYWCDLLASGTLTRDEVANSFAASPEFQAILKSYGL